MKNVLTHFDGDAEHFWLNFAMYLQIVRTNIYMATQNWGLLFSFEVTAEATCFELSHDQHSLDRACGLTASLQN